MEGIEKFDAQALSNTLWAFATLEIWHQPLKEAIASAAMAMQCELTTQEVANLSWALAKLWVHDTPFLRALASQAMSHVTELNKQELSVMAWAFATLNLRYNPLLSAIAAQAVERMSELGELEIFNTAWAFARISVRNERLMEAISSAAAARTASALGGSATVDNIEGLNPNGIYSIVWSSWRSGRAQLMASLAREQERPEVDSEPLVRGLLLMESAWQRDQLREAGVMSILLGLPGGDPGPFHDRFEQRPPHTR